ncbi:hypothetical protein HK104_007626 [Borealophlyctis nickersoniae]|nr:hypothetical protein HK104_007626 [Borealophlyctis nickersoniae]
MTILYPWHNELDKAFKELETDHAAKLDKYYRAKLERLSRIENGLPKLDHSKVRSKVRIAGGRGVTSTEMLYKDLQNQNQYFSEAYSDGV